MVAQDQIDAVPKDQLELDLAAIDSYLATNNIGHKIDPSGIRYSLTGEGSGQPPCLEGRLTAYYKGTLLSNGLVFDEGTTVFSPNQLILGFQIMLIQFGAGTKATLYLPSGFAYGTTSQPSLPGSGRPDIPANSILVFELEVISVP